ncbi:MAG: hypothetical protein Q4F40_10780 [Akkermansia sp.]|nr:hypothetical protein [Akkermansia sp.]
MKTTEDTQTELIEPDFNSPECIIDISSGMKDYPQFAVLSNLGDKPFVMDGIEFKCLEGFLQALKTDDRERQMELCDMRGGMAKREGSKIEWKLKQTLYWQGRAYGRHTEEYRQLISRAFQTCYDQCELFRKALAATGRATLAHSIGKDDPTQTILTIDEFVGRLLRLRECGTLF